MDAFPLGAVAWYGAIVATLTLAFNVWKYTRERARLQIRISRTFYPDGGIAKTERTPDGGTIETPNVYYHIEVVNNGERATTIMGVRATTKAVAWRERFTDRQSFETGLTGDVFEEHDGKRVPYELGPGQVWSCRVPDRMIDRIWQNGTPKLELVATCSNKPLYRPFPKPAQKDPPKVVTIGAG